MGALSTALEWLDKGMATIPIVAGGKTPAISKWKPYQDRLPTKEELHLWFGGGYSLAVITGWEGLVIIDWDDMEKYAMWMATLPRALRRMMNGTYRVSTARGMHFYFYVSEKTRTQPGNGVDVKAGGGYALAPPSLHPSGRRYLAVGSIDQIRHIDSVDELQLPASPPPPSITWNNTGITDLDPFDAAMQSDDFSGFKNIQSKWRVDDLLPGLSQHRGVRKTRCPFHNDTQASFAVYPDSSCWCFGCSFYARDVVGLYAALHKMSIGEAYIAMEAK